MEGLGGVRGESERIRRKEQSRESHVTGANFTVDVGMGNSAAKRSENSS